MPCPAPRLQNVVFGRLCNLRITYDYCTTIKDPVSRTVVDVLFQLGAQAQPRSACQSEMPLQLNPSWQIPYVDEAFYIPNFITEAEESSLWDVGLLLDAGLDCFLVLFG